MNLLALVLSLTSFLLGVTLLVEPRSRATVFLVWIKFLSNAWAPWLAAVGVLGAALGGLSASWAAVGLGLAGALLFARHVHAVTHPTEGLARAFGNDWHARLLASGVEQRMARRRWRWRRPEAPDAQVTRDLRFAVIPGTERALRCDIWEPASTIARTGTCIVYLHGSAWTLLDKDVGTRRFFRHLVAQGHVVMDIAYRLCPETDIAGMVGDAKRAVVWMKAHAAEYGARAEQVVLMGASAGAHVALLAAYTSRDPRLTPEDLRDVDTSVVAVVSYYGIPDMRDYDVSARRFLPPGIPALVPRRAVGRSARAICRWMFGRDFPDENLPPPPSHGTLMTELLGGLPHEVPAMYELGSPICHVTAACPPTMHLQGQHDQIAPIASARRLRRALEAAGVPAMFVEYPGTGHAFDLLVPPLLAPASQAALHDVEQFLACAVARPVSAPAPIIAAGTQHAPPVEVHAV